MEKYQERTLECLKKGTVENHTLVGEYALKNKKEDYQKYLKNYKFSFCLKDLNY